MWSYSDWFVPIQTEAELLALELSCERKLRAEAEEKLKDAIACRANAERERDIYKVPYVRHLSLFLRAYQILHAIYLQVARSEIK